MQRTKCIAVATTGADEAIASSDFLKIMGISPKKGATRVILVSFDHFASSDFNVWLRSWNVYMFVYILIGTHMVPLKTASAEKVAVLKMIV